MIINPKDIELVERPGFLGRKRNEKQVAWDLQYGSGNWALVWKVGDLILDFRDACRIYEDAYFMDSFKREDLWRNLFSKARDFFDNAETNVNSGTDYMIQESYSHHLQDIAVRRVGIRRGMKMTGDELIQIRGPKTKGYELMPGVVKFHEPGLITTPVIHPEWATPDSAEAFYQSTRWLAVKKH